MDINWKRLYLGSYCGYVDGREVAQVGQVKGPDGEMHGWLAHLTGQAHELPDRYLDLDAAKAAVERALVQGGG